MFTVIRVRNVQGKLPSTAWLTGSAVLSTRLTPARLHHRFHRFGHEDAACWGEISTAFLHAFPVEDPAVAMHRDRSVRGCTAGATCAGGSVHPDHLIQHRCGAGSDASFLE